MTRRAWLTVVLLAMVGCARGAPANKPQAVAERFMDHYFVEIDQQKALPLTDGSARATLEKELEDVASVRAGGYLPEDAKGRVYYERVYDRSEGESHRTIFNVTIEHEQDRIHRHVLVSLRLTDGQWRVHSFFVREGTAPKAPPP